MKKLLLLFCFLTITSRLFAQQFAQYNTGTLFDSFENPAERSFIPDSSRMFASNFFLPNYSGNVLLTGDAQQTIKTRAFLSEYNNRLLRIGNGTNYNYFNANSNAYALMFKFFASLDGKEEVGFFIQNKASSHGAVTDETVALLNGSAAFPDNSYTNVFNSNIQYQVYNQVGVTYREQVDKHFSLGVKLAYVMGIQYQSININQSAITFDKAADTASLYLKGSHYETDPKVSPIRNPGASISIGGIYRTNDGFSIQGNIKDLGFIYWTENARSYNFENITGIYGLMTSERENNVTNALKIVDTYHPNYNHFSTPLDGTAELSVSHTYFLGDENTIKYSPVLIASKELFYNGFTGGMVNPVQIKNYTISLTTEYNELRIFEFGGQFMIKGPNSEFFIGSDRLFQSARLVLAATKNQKQIDEVGAFSGGAITIGASFKFGPVIEHPMNASNVPMGDDDKGFVGRFLQKIFNPNKGAIKAN